MPAPVALSSTAHTSSKATGSKTRPPPRSRGSLDVSIGLNKKTRIVRRRGRAVGGIESDDEIEREVRTDSETDDDDQSSGSSDSDLDTEPASEDVLPNGHGHILTPDLIQKAGDVVAVKPPAAKSDVPDQEAFFGGPQGNWSEMVADENDNGPAELPVIDFADFDGHTEQLSSRKGPKNPKRAVVSRKPEVFAEASAVPETEPSHAGAGTEIEGDTEPVASTSRRPPTLFPTRAPGQTARQAYQQRLDKDPSYVPTVGEFWGHDDRLLDKDLRSLSGWWRGRWQGRGRSRGGFDRGFARGGGRGRFMGPQPSHSPNQDGVAEVEEIAPPPIDRAWGHDGFEEMKKKEEDRRNNARPVRGMTGPRASGRGAATVPRGRGGLTRGAVTSSVPRAAMSSAPASGIGRPWFAMKPEKMWTKQHDGFLHMNPPLKPRFSHGQGVQVKLPGAAAQVINLPPSALAEPPIIKPIVDNGLHEGEKSFVVKLPKRVSKQRQHDIIHLAESFTTVEEPPMDEPHAARSPVSRAPTNVSGPSNAHLEQAVNANASLYPDSPDSVVIIGVQADDQGWIQPQSNKTAETLIATSEISPIVDGRLPPPVLPPIQTSFTPIPQASPPYGSNSPYGYAPGLPPGVAMNQQGIPYEVSTGRVIYYQPPPQLYNPRPVMHTHMAPPGVSFVSGHMRHMTAASPDFSAPSHTPPVNGFVDPSTGAPIFVMPRQSSRIEIRAPLDGQASMKGNRRPSGLRTNATAFEPQRATNGNEYTPEGMSGNGIYAPDGTQLSEDSNQFQQQGMMGYPSYQQQYYYPGTEHYAGYQPYMDMSQVPQYGEMYPPDPHAAPPPGIYY